MTANRANLDRFVAAARRKIIWKYRLQRIQICLACACLLALMAWFSQPHGLTPMVILLALGFAAGCAWGASAAAKKSPLSVAMFADRKLSTADLLATAWAVPRDSTEPWACAVVAMADQRCRGLKSDALALSVINGRISSAVALSMALVLILGSIPRGLAHASRPPGAMSVTQKSTDRSQPTIAGLPPRPDRPAGDSHLIEPSDRQSPGDQPGPIVAAPSDAQGPPNADPFAGTGKGLAQSHNIAPDLPAPPLGANSTEPHQHGLSAGGGGAENPIAATPATTVGPSGPTISPPPSAPWAAKDWPAAQAAAEKSVQNDSIDPAYQDLVRDYFQP